MMLPLNIIDVFRVVRQSVVSSGEGVIPAALAIAGILAIFRLVVVASEIARGVETRFMTVIRPFILIICISMYQYIVIGPLDLVTDTLCRGVYSLSSEAMTENVNNFLKAWETQSQEEAKLDEMAKGDADAKDTVASTNADDKSDTKMSDVTEGQRPSWIVRLLKDIFGVICRSITVVMCGVVYVIYNVSTTVLELVAQICLAVLAIMGSFVFALAVFPELDNIKGWIASYIQVSLWAPLCQIVNYVVQMALVVHDDMQKINLDVGNAQDFLNLLGMNFFVMLAGIIMVFSVPSLASAIVAATGSGNTGSTGAQRTVQTGRMMAKVFSRFK